MGNSGVTENLCAQVWSATRMRHSNVKSECQLKQIKMQSVETCGRRSVKRASLKIRVSVVRSRPGTNCDFDDHSGHNRSPTARSHQYRRRMSACATKPDNLRARSNVGFWRICDIRALLMAVWFALRSGSFNATRIIHGREQECSPSAVLSLYPKGPRVLFRISSLGPYEPAIAPPEAPILELLRRLAARSDPLRVAQVEAAVVALDFLPTG